MAFSDAVHWWEGSQLRILVLASLFLQYFLLVTATMRKYRVWPWWVKLLTWLAYLASDGLAVYALATLFSRHRKEEWVSTHRKDAMLEALWVPILLLHLGGQDSITAYNIEDNELWSRHFLTAVSQIIVSIYVVVRKSWSGDDVLLKAAIILIFVPGVLKCMEKPVALWSASINSIETASGWGSDQQTSSRRRQHGRGTPNQSSGGANTRESQDGQNDATPSSLDEFVQAALLNLVRRTNLEDLVSPSGPEENRSDILNLLEKNILEKPCESEKIFGGMPYRLFVDLAYPYSTRLKNIKSMVDKRAEAHCLVRCGLSTAFDRLYTKADFVRPAYKSKSSKYFFGNLVRNLVISLTFAAVGLFHKSKREACNATDIKITYTLICCTASLEYINVLIHYSRTLGAVRQLPSPQVCAKHPWPGHIAQYNLMGYLARNKKYQGLRRLLFIGKDYVDQLLCMKPCSKSSSSITQLVHDHVMDGWRNCITDAATYRNFNDNRGQRTLLREEYRGEKLKLSLQRPFDESVILWHLATDLCFHDEGSDSASNKVPHLCREMSNYMAYLLFVNPDMLMPGARSSLFKDAYSELKKMVTENPSPRPGEENLGRVKKMVKDAYRVLCQEFKQLFTKRPSQKYLAQELINKQAEDMRDSVLVRDARVLFEELRELATGPEGWLKTWRVIQGVWVEMLCFSAGRCRGYLHAKSLGKGGEYLSYVWLLLWYMGMETVAEKMQRSELQAQGDIGATGPKSASLGTTTGENIA